MAKEFLSKNNFIYLDYDVSKNQDLEAELKKRTGTKIVPAIIIHQQKLFGLMKKEKLFIGFEQNKQEILSLIQ